MSDDRTFSLVLGAGGRAGLAYHAGTLLALELAGIDPMRARCVTGTSAGSIVAALLVAGADSEDLCSVAVDAPARHEFAALDASVRAAQTRRPRLSSAALARLIDPRRIPLTIGALAGGRTLAAALSVFPGLVDLHHRLEFLDDVDPASDRAMSWRVVAATPSGRRRVFDGPAGTAPPSGVVAASCAVPGIYAPVLHDGERLVDGGVHSTTNADLAADDQVDTVIVLAPMCADGGRPAFVGRTASAALRREVAGLRRRGRHVVVFRPSDRLRASMGANLLSGARARTITGAAFLEAATTLEHLDAPSETARPAASGSSVAPSANGR
jgi:NTE family protein